MSSWLSVSAGSDHTCAIAASGALHCFGECVCFIVHATSGARVAHRCRPGDGMNGLAMGYGTTPALPSRVIPCMGCRLLWFRPTRHLGCVVGRCLGSHCSQLPIRSEWVDVCIGGRLSNVRHLSGRRPLLLRSECVRPARHLRCFGRCPGPHCGLLPGWSERVGVRVSRRISHVRYSSGRPLLLR